MRRNRSTARANLHAVIEALPRHTSVAMLSGIEGNEIVVGAYSNRDGVCPMLAAHRAGGRTTAIAFAKAWDRFAFRNARRRQPRRATERELLILKFYLQASLLATPAEHPAPVRRYDDYQRLMALVESELGAASEVGCRPALRP